LSEPLREALGTIINAGYQLSAEGFEYLKTIDENRLKDGITGALNEASKSSPIITVLDRAFLQNILEEAESSPDPLSFAPRTATIKPLAAEYDAMIRLPENLPGEPQGDLDGYLEYFRSRFKKVERILRQRIDVREAVSIDNALKLPLKAKIKVIGIVTTKRSRGHRLFLDIEDREDSITVMATDSEVVRKGLSILQDQVICVDAVKYRQDLLVVRDFIWPDIPSKPPNRSEAPLCAAFLADVHIGSIHFNKELFDRFIRWMNLELGPPQSKRLAGRVKYVVIAGDLVDGIGVYPNQLKELEITDIREQYTVAGMLLQELPDHAEIIILPGNHDAVRKSLPQVPLSREYAEVMDENDRIHLYGNPSRLQLHGVETFISHGKALDEILSQVPGLEFQSPIGGMELLLRCRHVAPTYGSSTPIAPEREDRLVISATPDIFHMGHIHVHETKKYKGSTLIASGSWQDQTPFQKRVNLIPTVGVAPIVDLQTHTVMSIDFNKLG
jgi:DNA polymerase II small subunit